MKLQLGAHELLVEKLRYDGVRTTWRTEWKQTREVIPNFFNTWTGYKILALVQVLCFPINLFLSYTAFQIGETFLAIMWTLASLQICAAPFNYKIHSGIVNARNDPTRGYRFIPPPKQEEISDAPSEHKELT